MKNDSTPYAYEDPWNASFEQRLRQFKSRPVRVAYFYERADNSTFRYRSYNPTQVLNHFSQNVSASYFFLDDYSQMERVIQAADLAVICRTKYSHRYNEIVSRFKARGVRVLYDIDDLVFDIRYAHLVAETIGIDLSEETGWNTWFAYVSRHGAAVQLCDGCITTNRHLAARLQDYTGLPVTLMRNFMNTEQLWMSEQSLQKKLETKAPLDQKSKIWLGYFSGTPTHAKDFGVAKSALIQLMREDRRIHLLVAGYMAMDGVDKDIQSRIRHQPFVDYVNLQRIISSVDINLIPLIKNTFTDCKSELKFFEAAIVGVPSVATPTATLQDAISHQRNGFLSNAHQWQAVLQDVIASPALYETAVQGGLNTARTQYTWSTRVQEVLGALGLQDAAPAHCHTGMPALLREPGMAAISAVS